MLNIAIVTFFIAIIAGLKTKYIVTLCILGLITLPILIIVEPYRMSRLIAFIDPWANPKTEGYQLIQSLYAIGNGGLFGVGYLQSRQVLKFLPFAESDFIFAVICEEFGLFGAIILIACYCFLLYLGIKKSFNAIDRYNAMLSFSATICFASQLIINIAVVTGSIPPTGLPLPLISSGNTQIVIFMCLGGIIASSKSRNLT